MKEKHAQLPDAQLPDAPHKCLQSLYIPSDIFLDLLNGSKFESFHPISIN